MSENQQVVMNSILSEFSLTNGQTVQMAKTSREVATHNMASLEELPSVERTRLIFPVVSAYEKK